jgi:hypothetical protein
MHAACDRNPATAALDVIARTALDRDRRLLARGNA